MEPTQRLLRGKLAVSLHSSSQPVVKMQSADIVRVENSTESKDYICGLHLYFLLVQYGLHMLSPYCFLLSVLSVRSWLRVVEYVYRLYHARYAFELNHVS